MIAGHWIRGLYARRGWQIVALEREAECSTMHEWTFMLGSSTIGAIGERVVAVCRRCGLIRTGRVATATSTESRVDLRGDCPGEPQAPADHPIEPLVTHG
jgi:hypothetical protein